MLQRIVISIVVTALSSICSAQSYKARRHYKLTPQIIDTTTENIFIYETPNAFLYFRQRDITEIIETKDKPISRENVKSETLRKVLSSNNRVIRIKDVAHWYNEKARDSIYKLEPIDEDAKEVNYEFYFTGAELIWKGQFMIYSKSDRNVVTKGLFVHNKKGPYNAESSEFCLPSGKAFYSVVIALGE